MKRVLAVLPLLLALALTSRPSWADQPSATHHPYIDVVFAIDCSGSMGPVIETAKQKVWTIVNEIAKAEPAPTLRIGLIGYGDADRTFRTFPLTDDLDMAYKNLMTFRDEGWSSEYVGLSVHKATTEMEWSQSMVALKVIYVLGNETARQGPDRFDYAQTAPAAWKNDIIVNAIYCDANLNRNVMNSPLPVPNAPNVQQVNPQTGGMQPKTLTTPRMIAPGDMNNEKLTWMEMSKLGHGEYLEIAADGGAVTIPTPFDEKLVTLGNALNETYIPYGGAGLAGAANQLAQDANSAAVGGMANAANRAQAKSAMQYNSYRWDLVDASKTKDFDWSKVKEESLPENMQTMTLDQRRAYVAQNATARAALQTQIQELGKQRENYIRTEIQKQGIDTEDAFDDAVRRSLIQQAATKGFRFRQ